MTTIEMQNNIIRQVLTITDINELTKIEKSIYKRKAVAYDTNGNPLTKKEYIQALDTVINEVETEQDKGKTTDEVFKNISNAYNLE